MFLVWQDSVKWIRSVVTPHLLDRLGVCGLTTVSPAEIVWVLLETLIIIVASRSWCLCPQLMWWNVMLDCLNLLLVLLLMWLVLLLLLFIGIISVSGPDIRVRYQFGVGSCCPNNYLSDNRPLYRQLIFNITFEWIYCIGLLKILKRKIAI